MTGAVESPPPPPLLYRVARAFEQGYQGIAYRSRFDDGLSYVLDCWALFEGVTIEQLAIPEMTARDDPDLVQAAALHHLHL